MEEQELESLPVGNGEAHLCPNGVLGSWGRLASGGHPVGLVRLHIWLSLIGLELEGSNGEDVCVNKHGRTEVTACVNAVQLWPESPCPVAGPLSISTTGSLFPRLVKHKFIFNIYICNKECMKLEL